MRLVFSLWRKSIRSEIVTGLDSSFAERLVVISVLLRLRSFLDVYFLSRCDFSSLVA